VPAIPAAEYLRMSTEHQKYSLDNQATAIRHYASLQGFEVVRSYADSGKSGLVLKHRRGLAQLLSDVVGGPQPYKAILVYDVSRWGRFQDADEAAYYEFLCKSAGIPVHYCAETFINDAAMPNVVMKALKRVMAAEYSRDLSCKVYEGTKRISEMGFRAGGPAGYGLRRMLCAEDGTPKQILNFGERKNVMTDRVKLVPGPTEEVSCVREIYRMVIHERRTLQQIADELNRRGVSYCGRRWVASSVLGVVKNPKYTGCNVWGRRAKKLGGPAIRQPERSWTTKKLAFEALVDEATFNAAQRALKPVKSDEELLECLRSLLAAEGWLGKRVIVARRDFPCPDTYVARFGSLVKAYRLIGYEGSKRLKIWEMVARLRELREETVRKLLALFPAQVHLIQKTAKHRPALHFGCGLKMWIVVCQAATTRKGERRWLLPSRVERGELTLLCRCNATNTGLQDYHLVSGLRRGQLTLRDDDPLLREGRALPDLSSLFEALPNCGLSSGPAGGLESFDGFAKARQVL
jgi:DNA invertase Pin-like site-specific DNA recombinase